MRFSASVGRYCKCRCATNSRLKSERPIDLSRRQAPLAGLLAYRPTRRPFRRPPAGRQRRRRRLVALVGRGVSRRRFSEDVPMNALSAFMGASGIVGSSRGTSLPRTGLGLGLYLIRIYAPARPGRAPAGADPAGATAAGSRPS